MRRALETWVLSSVLLLASCAAPGSGGVPAATGELPRDLAEQPEIIPIPTKDAPKNQPAQQGKGTGIGKAEPVTENEGDSPPNRPGKKAAKPPATTDGSLARASDAQGDHGPLGPAYADLIAVELAARGESALALVDFGAALPTRLSDGEVMGVGIDIFRRDPGESDYQLFADGGSDGWFAYLQTPDGFVDYPGAFSLEGSRMSFEVPWGALGGRKKGEFSSFVDWSGTGVGVSPSSEDFVPENGTVKFQ